MKFTTAAVIASLALGAAGPVMAKGNGAAEERAKLQAELAKSRSDKSHGNDHRGGFFETLFGFGRKHDEAKGTAKPANGSATQ